MQMLSAILARTAASFIIASYSVAATSAETGPSTIAQISLVTSRMSRPDFMISEGLVVTPSIRPRSLSSLISPTSAVSTKNFMSHSQAAPAGTARCAIEQIRVPFSPKRGQGHATWPKIRDKLEAACFRARLCPCSFRCRPSGPIPMRCREGRGGGRRGRSCRCRWGRGWSPASSGTGRADEVDPDEAARDRPGVRLPAGRRADAALHRLGVGLHAVAAGAGGADGAEGARGLRSRADDRRAQADGDPARAADGGARTGARAGGRRASPGPRAGSRMRQA